MDLWHRLEGMRAVLYLLRVVWIFGPHHGGPQLWLPGWFRAEDPFGSPALCVSLRKILGPPEPRLMPTSPYPGTRSRGLGRPCPHTQS